MPVTDDGTEPSTDGGAADRSSPAVDVHARDWARTRTSDATAPPPPAEAAAVEAVAAAAVAEVRSAEPDVPPSSYDASPKAAVRVPGAPRRAPLVVQGLLPALAAALLAAAAVGGAWPLTAAVVALQVALVLAVLAVLGAPAARGAAVVAVAAALAADVVVVLDDGAVDRLSGVVGLALVVSLLHQLVRSGRSRVTESLADTLLAVVVSVAAACLLAVRHTDGGDALLLAALATAAGTLLAGRLTDRLLLRPVLAVGATRGWPGLVVGLLAGLAAAVLVADLTAGELSPSAAALLGLVVAVTVVTADLAVDLGAAELRPGRRDARRAAALQPTAALLPLAVLGPLVLLAGRLVLS